MDSKSVVKIIGLVGTAIAGISTVVVSVIDGLTEINTSKK